MITQQQWAGIKRLLDAGLSVPQVNFRTGVSLPMIYKFKKTGMPKPPQHKRNEIAKKLEKYKNFIDSRIKLGVYNASKLHEELKEQGSTAKYFQVNNYVRSKVGSKRSNKHSFYKKPSTTNHKPSIRFETGPGIQAQVDWTYIKKTKINGKTERIYLFVYILGYSRMKYCEFMLRQNLRALIECQMHAFETLGIPQEVVYDNMKSVVTERIRLPNKLVSIQLTSAIKDFAKYYGFKVAPTAPHHPRSKGKVERAIEYFKQNFLPGVKIPRNIDSLDELNIQVQNWLKKTGNFKPNETTQERPFDRWIKEKPFLIFPDRIPPYQLTSFESRFSDKDGTIDYNSCVYQMPFEYVRKKIDFTIASEKGIPILEFYYEDELISKHYLSAERHKWIKETDAIFFKASPKKKFARKDNSKKMIKKSTNIYSIIIPQTPMSYYNQVIFGTKRGINE